MKIRLKNGKELDIQHTSQTMFWDASGTPISAEAFLNNLFGELPKLFTSEEELRKIWSSPITRKTLLEKLEAAGYGKEEFKALQKLINAENSDLFDVLEHVFNSEIKPVSRTERVEQAGAVIFSFLDDEQKSFVEFVLQKYIEAGVGELDQSKLPILLTSMFQSQEDGIQKLGGDAGKIRKLFIDFQKHLYTKNT